MSGTTTLATDVLVIGGGMAGAWASLRRLKQRWDEITTHAAGTPGERLRLREAACWASIAAIPAGTSGRATRATRTGTGAWKRSSRVEEAHEEPGD